MKRIVLLLLTVLCFLQSYAQDGETAAKAQRVLDAITANKCDSLYDAMSPQMQAAITKTQLSVVWYTMEMSYGKLKNVGEWETGHMMGYDIAKSILTFENNEFDCTITFNGDEIAGLLFTPRQKEAVGTDDNLSDNSTMKELQLSCDGYVMPAVLTMPEGCENPPCIIIVHGSGPNDKDGSIGKNKPYKELAGLLAERGIATFRYDKRTYVYRTASDTITVDDETTDDAVAAAMMMHSGEYGIDTARIYVLGHSLGGMMIPRIAKKTDNVRGYIMMSAPARPFLDIIVAQMDYLYQQGFYPAWPEAKQEMERQINNIYNYGNDKYDPNIPAPLGMPVNYIVDLNKYDQTLEAEDITKPLLIMNGTGDYQVTMEDFAIWQKVLSGHDNVIFKSYDGLNHIYHEAGIPPSPTDYEKQGNIPSKVIDDIVDFVSDN